MASFRTYLQKIAREPISGLTHLFGAFLAIIGLVFLIKKALKQGDILTMAGYIIFGMSMITLYMSSALYHLLKVSERAILWLKKLDHSMIYVLIAGTYTPVCLTMLEGAWRWIPFFTIWSLALVGILAKMFWIDAPRWLSTTFYLALGWMGIVLFPVLFGIAPPGFLIWLGIGGLAYTFGAIIYGLEKPNPVPDFFGAHEIWHIFVMVGTFSHFWAIYMY